MHADWLSTWQEQFEPMPKLAKARRAQYGGLNANHLVLRIEQLQNPLYYRYPRAQARDHCSSRRTLTLKATSGYRVRGQADIARRSQNDPTGPAIAAIRCGYRGSGARTGSPQRSPSTRRRGRRCRPLAMTGGFDLVRRRGELGYQFARPPHPLGG